MARSRYINTKFWSDTYVDTLDPSEKLLFLYFLTNERTTISGVYELPVKIMAVETGFDRSMIEKIIERFSKDGKMFYEDGFVIMINAHKHQNLRNSKITAGIEREISELPNKIREKLKSHMSHTLVIDDSLHFNSNLNSNLDLTKPKKKETSIVGKNIEELDKDNSDVERIIVFWNSLPSVTKCRKVTTDVVKSITKALKEYTGEEIAEAMNKYSIVLSDDKYLFKYNWNISLFCTRSNALPHFFDTPMSKMALKDTNKKAHE